MIKVVMKWQTFGELTVVYGTNRLLHAPNTVYSILSFFFLKLSIISLLQVFLAADRLFPRAAGRLQCVGFSCGGFSRCGTRALERGLNSFGTGA